MALHELSDAVELAFTEVTRIGRSAYHGDPRCVAATNSRPHGDMPLRSQGVYRINTAVGRIAQIEKGEQDIRLRIETGKRRSLTWRWAIALQQVVFA